MIYDNHDKQFKSPSKNQYKQLLTAYSDAGGDAKFQTNSKDNDSISEQRKSSFDRDDSRSNKSYDLIDGATGKIVSRKKSRNTVFVTSPINRSKSPNRSPKR